MNNSFNDKFNKKDILWNSDEIQFSRLLSEIYNYRLSNSQYHNISESTGLSEDKIEQIFIRAQMAWHTHKLNNM